MSTSVGVDLITMEGVVRDKFGGLGKLKSALS